MEAKTFLLTMGVSLAAGAAMGLMVPKNAQLRQATQKAAHTVEQAVDKAASHILQ